MRVTSICTAKVQVLVLGMQDRGCETGRSTGYQVSVCGTGYPISPEEPVPSGAREKVAYSFRSVQDTSNRQICFLSPVNRVGLDLVFLVVDSAEKTTSPRLGL